MDTAKVQQVRNWAWLTLGACGVALVGLCLPWTTGTGTYRDVTPSADSPKLLVAALLITAAALIPIMAPHVRWAVALPAGACALVGGAMAFCGICMVWVVESNNSYDGLAVGAGTYVSVFAGTVLYVSTMFMVHAAKRIHNPASTRVSRSTASTNRVGS